MAWRDYEAWRAGAQGDAPEMPLVDGVLTGSVISLRSFSDDQWIEMVVGEQALCAEPETLEGLAVTQLKQRLVEIRSALASDQHDYTPILTMTEEGDFDLTAWATGFIEAIAPDLETWTYILANKSEGGLLGLLGSYAVGAMGEAARASISRNDNRAALLAVREQSWEFIPQLVKVLYAKKLELAGQSELPTASGS